MIFGPTVIIWTTRIGEVPVAWAVWVKFFDSSFENFDSAIWWGNYTINLLDCYSE